MPNFIKPHVKRLRRHGTWVAGALGGQALARMLLPQAVLVEATSTAGDFLQSFSGVYGIIVAFVIYVVWEQHNETQITIEREAVSLCELFRLLTLLTSWERRAQICNLLRRYAAMVPRVNDVGGRHDADSERKLVEDGFSAFLSYNPNQAREQRFYDEALSLFRQLIETREHRHTIAALRLPDALRWFVFLGGAVCVATLWLSWFDSQLLQGFFVACMTWVVVAASSIVVDLDDPYTGDFVVDFDRFFVAAERMQALQPIATPEPNEDKTA